MLQYFGWAHVASPYSPAPLLHVLFVLRLGFFYVTVYSVVCFTNSLLFLFALSVFFCVIVVYFRRLLFQHSSFIKGVMQELNFSHFFSCFHGIQMSHKQKLTLLYKCPCFPPVFLVTAARNSHKNVGRVVKLLTFLACLWGVNNLFKSAASNGFITTIPHRTHSNLRQVLCEK